MKPELKKLLIAESALSAAPYLVRQMRAGVLSGGGRGAGKLLHLTGGISAALCKPAAQPASV